MNSSPGRPCNMYLFKMQSLTFSLKHLINSCQQYRSPSVFLFASFTTVSIGLAIQTFFDTMYIYNLQITIGQKDNHFKWHMFSNIISENKRNMYEKVDFYQNLMSPMITHVNETLELIIDQSPINADYHLMTMRWCCDPQMLIGLTY